MLYIESLEIINLKMETKIVGQLHFLKFPTHGHYTSMFVNRISLKEIYT